MSDNPSGKKLFAKNKFISAFMTTSFWTFCSRIGGFFRESLLAHYLGASHLTDLLFLAMRLPSLFRRVFAEGALGNTFIPIFTKLYMQNEKMGKKFAKQVLISVGLIILSFIGIFEIFADNICRALFSGMSGERIDILIDLYRLAMTFLFFAFLTDFFGGILNAFQRFAPYAAAPVFGNIFIVSGFILTEHFVGLTIYHVAFFCTFAGCIQFLVTFISCKWIRFSLKTRFRDFLFLFKKTPYEDVQQANKQMNSQMNSQAAEQIINQGVNQSDNNSDSQNEIESEIQGEISKTGNLFIGKFLKSFSSAAFSSSISQLDILIGIYIASFLAPGGVSYLNFSDRILQLPLSFIGITVSSITLSFLAKKLIEKDHDGVKKFQRNIFEFGIILSSIAAFHMVFFSSYIIDLVFGWGKFTKDNVVNTSLALQGYSIGLPFFVLLKIFNSFCFARKDSKTPLKINSILFFLSTTFSFIGLKVAGHIGIAYATSIAAFAGVILFIVFMYIKGYFSIKFMFFLRLLSVLGLNYVFIHFTREYLNDNVMIFLSLSMLIALIMITKITSVRKIKELFTLD